MELIDSRRLMGPNRVSRVPCAVAEVKCDDSTAFERAWRAAVVRMLERLGWKSTLFARHFKGGIELALTAPIDVLLAATEVNDWAIFEAMGTAPAFDARAQEIEAMIAEQKNPRLLAIEAEARERDVPFLWDDDAISLGLGKHSRTWPRSALPNEIDWSVLKRIPVALVTGTNGKTTTARLLTRMCKEAGLVCGNTATDGIVIDGVQETEGDYTGPVAARLVLRDPRVEIAVLETARGGILRRGLAIDGVDVAVITNVSEDHMGGYGIDALPEMVATKAVVGHAVRKGGLVVLNGEDVLLREQRFEARTAFFDARKDALPCPVEEVPITFSGRARYNVENALACVLAARALGLPESAIVAGLKGFVENPGRTSLTQVRGVSVMLDFAHNPKAIDAILALASSLPKKELIIITGGAGDRLDPDLRAAAAPIARAKPKHVLLRDLQGYLRGRAEGEVPRVIKDALVRSGMAESAVTIAQSEAAALEKALAMAKPGDLILLLVHLERDAVQAVLKRHAL